MVLDTVFSYLGDYGWYFLILLSIGLYVYYKFAPQIEDYNRRREDAAYTAKYRKDPDLFSSRISEQQSYIQNLQEQYQREAELHQEKLKEKEESRRRELLAKYEHPSGSGKRLGTSSTSSKPEYNPLMGDTSRSYRPPKKTCGGGGCGR